MKRIYLFSLVLFLLFWPYRSSFAQMPTLDSSFGVNGVTHIDFSTSTKRNDLPRAMEIQPDGKIVIGGFSEGESNDALVLARLLPNGMLDPDFANSGKTIMNWSVANLLYDLKFDSEGRIVAAGTEVFDSNYTQYIATIYRFLPNGKVDSSFGIDGRRFQALSGASWSIAFNVFIGDSDKIYGTGVHSFSIAADSGEGFGAFRLDSTGIIDQSYNSIYKKCGYASAQLDDSEYIYMASRTARTGPKDTAQLLLAGFTPAGKQNTALGPNGCMQLPYNVNYGEVTLAKGGGSKYLLGFGTYRGDGITRQFSLVRWDSKGMKVDSSFGTNGSVNGTSSSDNEIIDCHLQPNGKILTAGAVSIGKGIGSIHRFLADGQVDTAFGSGGSFDADINNNAGTHYFVKIRPLSNSSFYVLGYDLASNNGDMFVAKYKMPFSAVKTVSGSFSYSLYPNPATSEITIASNEINFIFISDALGREIASLKGSGESIRYDVQNLPNGVYYCTVQSATGRQTRKFVVSH
jgi:uncharacterized delta-60 repeat protein